MQCIVTIRFPRRSSISHAKAWRCCKFNIVSSKLHLQGNACKCNALQHRCLDFIRFQIAILISKTNSNIATPLTEILGLIADLCKISYHKRNTAL